MLKVINSSERNTNTFHNKDKTITDPILRQNISIQQVVVATRNSTFKIVPLTPKARYKFPGLHLNQDGWRTRVFI